MKYTVMCALAVLVLGACSTHPDGRINWADNPLNNAAGKIDDGLQRANRAMEPLAGGKRRGAAMPSAEDERSSGGGFGRNGLAPGVHESGMSYKDLLEMGVIRKNPDYPKTSKQRYVFTSLNCTGQYRCLTPNNHIAPRP